MDALIKSLLIVTTAFSLVICLLLFAFSLFFDINRYLLLPISIQLLCDGIVGVFYSKAKFSYDYRKICTMSIISSVVPVVISVGILFWGGGAAVRIYSLLFVSLILALYALTRLIYRGKKAQVGLIKYSFKQALPILPHSVSSALSAQADKLIITAVSGSAALAKYSVAHSLGAATSFLGVAIGSALHPWIVRRLEGGRISEIRDLIIPIFSFLCAFSMLPIIFAPELIGILAPYGYYDSTSAVLPIALSCLPSFLIATTTVGLVFKGKGRYTASLSLITAVFSLGMSIGFTLLFGYFGAGLALLLSQSVGAVAGGAFLKKCSLSEIFDTQKLLFSFLFTTLIGSFALFLSNFLALRVALLIVPALILLNLFFGYKPYILESA